MRIVAIMPFRGDVRTLAWVLEGFAMQNLDAGQTLEVRVYGDGVPTPPMPLEANKHITFSATSGPHVGVGEAKNILLRDLSDDVDVIFMANADTRPEPTVVRGHAHRLISLPENHMVLGAAPYEPANAPTVFDALKEQTPMIFFYHQMRGGELYDFRHVWTLNLSVRFADLKRIGFFNPLFRPWGFEDLDVGHRLMGESRGVYFDPSLVVTHRHPMTFEQYLDREELLGAMAPVLHATNPAAFARLYGTDDIEKLARQFRGWVEMDEAAHRWVYRRMSDWCELPATALGEGAARERLTMTLYQMHLPLKRLAFRLSFLWGMELSADEAWKKRTAQGEWRKRVM